MSAEQYLSARSLPAIHPSWEETERLAVLARYGILDTASEAEFDDIAQLASQICETPISLISLVENKRHWFKAKVGISIDETPLEAAICPYGLREHSDIFIIGDTAQDQRFQENPLIQEMGLRFYAGAVIRTSEGLPLGVVCVLDTKPRELNDIQKNTLTLLARQVMKFMDLRRSYQVQGNVIDFLRTSDERCQTALQGCGIGVWDWDLLNNRVYADVTVSKLLHLSEEVAGAGFPSSRFVERVYEEDQAIVRAAGRRTFEGNEPFSVEYRIIQPNGTAQWIRSLAQCHFTADGTPYRLIGCSYALGQYTPDDAPILKIK